MSPARPFPDDRSSNAPDRPAVTNSETHAPKGFFGRILGALAASDDGARAGGAVGAPDLQDLGRRRVADIAIPKVEIVAAPADSTLDALVDLFREHEFSRVPIFQDSLDHPLGLIHMKDLALKHGFGRDAPFDLQAMLRPLLYVPPSASIGILLQQMQQNRAHMALVIDEYGGVDGLVTLEDLIEQIVGEIDDEHDDTPVALWVDEHPGQWLLNARAPLSEIEAHTGLRLFDNDSEDVDTLAGLIIALADRVPGAGEVVLHPSGTAFEIVEADPRRLKTVRMRRPDAEKPSETDAEAARATPPDMPS